MRKTLLLGLIAVSLSGCLGDSSRDNELIGQAKGVQQATPLLCPNYVHVDISLGVLRNGVGSMSTQDLWLYVPNAADVKALKQASESGVLVKVTYDVARSRWFGCVENETVTHVELIKN